MPFTKISRNKYKSPSGRTFSASQVRLYYATNGFKTMKKKYKRVVDNKMRDYGDTDTEKKRKDTRQKKLSRMDDPNKFKKTEKVKL